MRTQLNLLTERVSFVEACDKQFRSCTLQLDAMAPTRTSPDATGADGLPLSRWGKHASQRPMPSAPASLNPTTMDIGEPLIYALHNKAPAMTPGQLCILSLNLGILDRVPRYSEKTLQGERLAHPIECIGRLSNNALESLTLELRTLNMEYLSTLYNEDRVMSVRETDISSFVRQGRSIISQEVNRTVGYFHEIDRIANGLRQYYAILHVPLDNDKRTRGLLRNLCRALTTAMGHLREGMVIFEQRLRDVASCNAALKIGAINARRPSAPPSPTASLFEELALQPSFVLPNVMRPSQNLVITTPKQVSALILFFSEYAEIIGKSFADWAMLHGNIADLVVVIRDPAKREIHWPESDSPDLLPQHVPDDVLSFEDDEEQLACIRSLCFDPPAGDASPDEPGPSATSPVRTAYLR